MTQDGTTPHPLDRQDAEALIGVTAVLEGHLITGDLDPNVVDRLSERLVGPDAGAAELRVVLWNLNKGLRYVLEEHDEPPVRDPGLVDLYVGFTAQATAHAFSQAVPSAGAPVAVDGRSYDDETVRWEVPVRSTTPPLSAEFDLERARLLALAAQHGGRDGGWGSPPPLDLTP
jgi:hypothetical protein